MATIAASECLKPAYGRPVELPKIENEEQVKTFLGDLLDRVELSYRPRSNTLSLEPERSVTNTEEAMRVLRRGQDLSGFGFKASIRYSPESAQLEFKDANNPAYIPIDLTA